MRNGTGYQGVGKGQKGYHARQWINKRRLYLGSYDSPQEAARAYAIAQDKKSRAIVVRQPLPIRYDTCKGKREMNLKRAEDEWQEELKAANNVLKLWLNL